MKILMPVDGSDSANAMLDWFVESFSTERPRVHLLTVISEPMIAEYEVSDAMKILNSAKDKLQAQGFRVEKSEYIMGQPVEAICQVAEDNGVDQIMMGSHGRSGIARALLGSVSEGVLERCHNRPVFIYRSRQDQMAGNRK